MGRARDWLFRVLVLAGGGLLAYTWFQPWWHTYVVEVKENAVVVFPWALNLSIPPEVEDWFTSFDNLMPSWFFTLMWIYFGLCIAALLFSLFASSEKGISLGRFRMSLPTALISGVGLSYIVIVVAALVTIAMRVGDFYNAPLMGSIYIDLGAEADVQVASWVDTGFNLGYWLACAAGPVLIIFAIFRNKIIGRSD